MRRLLAPLRWIIRASQHAAWVFFGLLCNRGNRLGELVDAQGITVFVGPNGSGKSLLAVDSMLSTLDGMGWECADLDHVHNRPVRAHVEACEDGCDALEEQWCEDGEQLLAEHGHGIRYAYSTLTLRDPATGRDHPLYRPLIDYRQLIEIEHADVLFDEVAGVSDASDSASTPAALTRWLQQLRKRDVRLRVTTPAYDRCSKPIRQVATLVVDCRSFFAEDSETGRLWRPRRGMLLAGYDGFAFASFDKHSGDRLDAMARRFYWRPSGRAQHAYSTLAQVHALAEVTDAGMCMACGGARSRPRCSCGPEVEAIPYGSLKVVEEVSKAGARVRKAIAADAVSGSE